VQRPDFDEMALLPARHVVARPAKAEEIGGLTAIAAKAIPALAAAEPVVRRVHRHNPDSIWAVSGRQGPPIGVFAMLLLNRAGLAALHASEFNGADPLTEHLAAPGETVAAVYLWAIVTPGLAIEAFRVISLWLRLPKLHGADVYTRPTTQAGLRLSLRLGFEPIPEIGLYCFQRHWHRKEVSAVA
jgi:hypothetical protein